MTKAPAGKNEPLVMWTIYRRPKDYPDMYVCRKWCVYDDGRDPVPDTALAGVSMDLEYLREQCIPKHCVKIMPDPTDDPVILETWL